MGTKVTLSEDTSWATDPAVAAELAGAQWNEGDVFCSVVRRVALPDAFFAIDGLMETFLTVLADFGAFDAVIEAESLLGELAADDAVVTTIARDPDRAEPGHRLGGQRPG